jgi:ParB-like chromosome segregation protein Spo0J
VSAQILEQATAVLVPIDSLVLAESPRTAGINIDHVRVLAEVDLNLPPILVQRSTMRVIDGAHRVQAAASRGAKMISARYFDGDESAAFVLAVESNVEHGLPLTLAERTSAAARIIRSYPQWSDRRIGAVTGLSPKTVGAIRTRSSEEIPQSRVRVGLDGRARRVALRRGRQPVRERPLNGVKSDAADGPTDTQPDATPGPSPLPRNARWGDRLAEPRTAPMGAQQAAIVQVLRKDPSLRFTETGRTLLRLLELHSIDVSDWKRIVANVPSHCASMVADLARDCGEAWLVFADCLGEKPA